MNGEQIQKRLEELYGKWKSQTISAEELFELQEWMSMNREESVIVPSEFAVHEEELKTRMFKNIENRQASVIRLSKIRRFRTVAAASLVFAIISAAVGYFILQSSPEIGIQSVSATDVKPGEDRAILQLADGSRIVLDNTKNGIIQKQGDARVIKSDGSLSYSNVSSNKSNSDVFNIMFTPRGGQYKLKLSDGTLVWLNSASSIRYPASFSGKERVVELKGEAYFEVAKNALKPFKVKADNLNVHVLGTHFNVNAYYDEENILTTLLEGSIKVNTGNNDPVKMVPGDQLKASRSKNNTSLLKNVDLANAVSWQQGIFEFTNADLPLIARQLSRWYDIDVFTEGNINRVKLGGGISKKSPLSQILKVMEKSGVNHKWKDGKLILYAG